MKNKLFPQQQTFSSFGKVYENCKDCKHLRYHRFEEVYFCKIIIRPITCTCSFKTERKGEVKKVGKKQLTLEDL